MTPNRGGRSARSRRPRTPARAGSPPPARRRPRPRAAIAAARGHLDGEAHQLGPVRRGQAREAGRPQPRGAQPVRTRAVDEHRAARHRAQIPPGEPDRAQQRPRARVGAEEHLEAPVHGASAVPHGARAAAGGPPRPPRRARCARPAPDRGRRRGPPALPPRRRSRAPARGLRIPTSSRDGTDGRRRQSPPPMADRRLAQPLPDRPAGHLEGVRVTPQQEEAVRLREHRVDLEGDLLRVERASSWPSSWARRKGSLHQRDPAVVDLGHAVPQGTGPACRAPRRPRRRSIRPGIRPPRRARGTARRPRSRCEPLGRGHARGRAPARGRHRSAASMVASCSSSLEPKCANRPLLLMPTCVGQPADRQAVEALDGGHPCGRLPQDRAPRLRSPSALRLRSRPSVRANGASPCRFLLALTS